MVIGRWIADWWTPFGCEFPAWADYINYTLVFLLVFVVIGYLFFTISGRSITVNKYKKVFKLRRPWYEGLFTFLGLDLIFCYAAGLSLPCVEGKLHLIGSIAILFVLEAIIGSVIYAVITKKAPAKVKYTSIFARR